jgi:hypothetical protein
MYTFESLLLKHYNINMKHPRPWMLANLKIIWQFHAHPVHQKVWDFLGRDISGRLFQISTHCKHVPCNTLIHLTNEDLLNIKCKGDHRSCTLSRTSDNICLKRSTLVILVNSKVLYIIDFECLCLVRLHILPLKGILKLILVILCISWKLAIGSINDI